jgi:two-component system NarL family sensor kinase
LKIDFQSYGSFDGLTQSYKLNIYRITQELVKNVMVHARANHALVQLLQNENKVVLSVEDNGTGFNVNEIKGGMGLHNLRTRASSLDGLFILESIPGKGTTVIIDFELPATPKTNENIN